MNLTKKNYLIAWIKLFNFFLIIMFLHNCALPPREVMKEGIKTTNRIKNMRSITKDSVKEEMITNTKRAIEKMGR